jgi:hypothetical protein
LKVGLPPRRRSLRLAEGMLVAAPLDGQGFVVGLADRINIHPVLRGALIGAAMTLQLSMMPLFGPFKLGAALDLKHPFFP